MRLPAYTLIEGIISIVLISLLLSAGGLISFNLYKSLPRNEGVRMQSVLKSHLDSLTNIGTTKTHQYDVGVYRIDYSANPWNSMDHLFLAKISIADTLDHQESMERIFVCYED